MSEFVSMMSPKRGTVPTGRISSPVGMIATTGRRATATAACPPAATAARSPGRSRRPAGTRTSPAAKSSPAVRTFRPRAGVSRPVAAARPGAGGGGDQHAAVRLRQQALPHDHGVRARRHRVAGVDPLERPGGQPHRPVVRSRVAGAGVATSAAAAAARSAARTAIPSIAAQSERGDGHRAATGTGGDPAERLADRDPLTVPVRRSRPASRARQARAAATSRPG